MVVASVPLTLLSNSYASQSPMLSRRKLLASALPIFNFFSIKFIILATSSIVSRRSLANSNITKLCIKFFFASSRLITIFLKTRGD